MKKEKEKALEKEAPKVKKAKPAEKESKKEVAKKEKTAPKKEAVKKEPKESFFKSVKKELSHVSWPTGKEMAKFSIAVIGFIVFFALFFWGIEIIFAWLKSLV